jgi:hypothetical protein
VRFSSPIPVGIAQNATGAMCQSNRHDWRMAPVRWRTPPVRGQTATVESGVSTNRGETDERPFPCPIRRLILVSQLLVTNDR